MKRVINENEANHRKYNSDLKRKSKHIRRPSSSPSSSDAPPPPSRPGSNHRSSSHEGPNHQGPNHRDSFMSLLSALVGLFVVSFDSVIITLFVSARADFVGAVLPDLSFRHRFVSRNAARPPSCAQALKRDRNRGRGVPRPRVLVRNAHIRRKPEPSTESTPVVTSASALAKEYRLPTRNFIPNFPIFLSVLDHSD